MAPSKPPMGFKFHYIFFVVIDPSFSNLMSCNAPRPFTLGDPIDLFALNTSFASLSPNTYEPPPTIVACVASLSLKGKGLMVDEFTSMVLLKFLMDLLLNQKSRRRLNGKSIRFIKSVGL